MAHALQCWYRCSSHSLNQVEDAIMERGPTYHSVFEDLLDYARHLGFDEPIDYDRYRADFVEPHHSEAEIKRDVSPG